MSLPFALKRAAEGRSPGSLFFHIHPDSGGERDENEKISQNYKQGANTMETNKKNEQTQGSEQKLIFVNFDRYFWSKDYTKLFLVLPGNLVVPVHANFLKARLHLPYTPKTPKSQAAVATTPQVA
jgi:hypothetical protein